MKEFLKRLIILIIGFLIFIGIPLYFDQLGLFFISWLPALFAIMYLDDV